MTDAPSGCERVRLVEAMARSCAERGYEETTVAHLSAAAGCSPATFDRHFHSKEECALAAVETILAEGIEVVGRAYSADRSEWESVLRALEALLVLFSERPALARLAFIDPRQTMPRTAFERYQAGFAILTAMLDRLRAGSSVVLEAPPTAARAAIGGGEALVRRELAAGRGHELAQILPDLVYAGTVPFLGQEEALRLTRQARQSLAEQTRR